MPLVKKTSKEIPKAKQRAARIVEQEQTKSCILGGRVGRWSQWSVDSRTPLC